MLAWILEVKENEFRRITRVPGRASALSANVRAPLASPVWLLSQFPLYPILREKVHKREQEHPPTQTVNPR